MKLSSFIVPAIAAFGLSMMSHAAIGETAGSAGEPSAGIQKAPSTFTLIANRGGGGGMGGGRAMGGMGRGGGEGGMGGGRAMGGMGGGGGEGGMGGGRAIRGIGGGGGAMIGVRPGSIGGSRTAFAARGNRTAFAARGNRTAFVRGDDRGFARGGNRTVIIDRRGRRGYWRGGRWFPIGVGIGIGLDGSCYWNCRNSGRGPGFCRAYAFDYCY